MEPKRRYIKPSLPGGLLDYLPSEMIQRQKMFDTIRMVFERFGFVPLDTPCIERLEVLVGGEENFDADIYLLRGAKDRIKANDESTRALRFDFTVPLARVVAAYPELMLPMKRYQVGKAFRGEKAQAGRFNEFVQFDADIVGTKSVFADAEIVAIMYETMLALGVPNFTVGVNNRKVLNGLPVYAGFDPAIIAPVLRILDKEKKIGKDGVIDLLMNGDPESRSDDFIKNSGMGMLSQEQAEKILEFMNAGQGTNAETLDKLSQMLNADIAQEGIQELRDIMKFMDWYGVPEGCWKIDLSVIRGLGYYTGPVFETYLADLPAIGSVFSGGRYDGLVERFSPSSVPATGASVGVDRLFVALQQLGLTISRESTADVIILPFGDSEVVKKTCIALASSLRNAGIKTDFFLNPSSPRELLGQAAKRSVPVAVIIGDNEIAGNTVTIRNMLTRAQETVPQGEPRFEGALQKIRAMLA